MSIIETISVIIMCMILVAVVVMMFPLIVDTVKNEIDMIKKEKRKRGKRK